MVAVVGLTLLLAACGGSGGESHSAHGGAEQLAAPVDGAETIEVSAIDIDYQPESLQLKAGEALNVAVTNDGDAQHDFTFEESDTHFDVPSGGTKEASITVDEPGTYEAFCSVAGHKDAGMTVEITVE